MRVGLDALHLGTRLDGTQLYVRNMVRVLPILAPHDRFALLMSPSVGLSDVAGTADMDRIVVRSRLGRVPLPLAMSRALVGTRLNLVHVQFAAPLYCPTRIVVTVHDVMFERHPEYFAPAMLAQLRARVPSTMRRASTVLTSSEFSKQDIVARFHLPPEKVVVAYLAPDPMYQPLRDLARLAAVRQRYGTGERFVLFVGALKPNKNLQRVVEAYVRLRRADALRHRLVLVGAGDIADDATFASVRGSGYADDIIFTGHVSDEEVVSLYNAAEVFVHPSLFEGFGLPPLEAMACGTPVITANTTSLPEVVGDAAVQVDPLDVEALAGAMARVTGDAGLRAELRARGLERAGQFTWEKTARATLQVYRQVARAPKGRLCRHSGQPSRGVAP